MKDIGKKKSSCNYCFLFIAVLMACFFYWLQSRNCSLHPGRDMSTYWSYYREFFKVEPGSKTLMLFRTPFTPLFFGLLFDFFGTVGVQVVLSVLYVVCLATVYLIGARLSVWVGFLALVLLGLDIQYFYFFFGVGSEGPQSFLIVLWIAYAFFTFQKADFRYWVLHALLVWLLILNRPGNQVMILCAFFPLLNIKMLWQRRLLLSLTFLISYGACHVVYSSYNYVRFNAFQVSTMGNALMPFYRVYLQDGFVHPENGPRSEELAQLVETKILSQDLMQRYQIDREMFFNMPTQRMYNHILQSVADEYGWEHQWLILRQVSMEAIAKYPLEFFLTYIDHLRDVFFVRGDGRYDISPYNKSRPDFNAFRSERCKLYRQLDLPIPTENDLLPAPDSGNPAVSSVPYRDQTYLKAKKDPVTWTFPDRHCSYHWGDIFDMYGVKIPFAFLFIIIGLFGSGVSLLKKRTCSNLIMLCIFGISFLNLSVTLMGSVQLPFRFPFDPVFILLGCFGFHGILSLFLKKKRMK